MRKPREKKSKGSAAECCRPATAEDLEKELARLPALDLDQLRREWKLKFNSASPVVRSRETLLRLLAWEIQANMFGGLDADTTHKLHNIAKALERDGDYEPKVRRGVSPGVVLTREWKGVVHKVTVMTDGFQHLGKRYGSLSDIARTITGTRWSGPRFFGLEQKPDRRMHVVPAVVTAELS